jgi:hypothetical protein
LRPSWPTEITPKVLSADGPKGLSDAAEIDVDEVLADPSWRWLKVFLPANFEHGYIASWKGG